MISCSWRAIADRLEDVLAEASEFSAPTTDVVGSLQVPLSITAAVDDPVHPFDVARAWRDSAAFSALSEITLTELGADPSVLGRKTIAGWRSMTAS